jgi:curved DNA-binding protein CbpA
LTPLEKDYYRILGVLSTATPEQIKDNYRKLAKKYHPDVRSADKTEERQPDADKFRDVVEAYQVLSVRESRVNYDLSRKKNPDAYKPVSDYQFAMDQRRDKRDKSGMIPKDKPARGSYAEDRLNQLKKDREQYNVNHLGYYSGGIP